MAVVLTREIESEVHAFLFWKIEGDVDYAYCGTAQEVIRTIGSDLYIAQDIAYGDANIPYSDYIWVLSDVISDMGGREFTSQLNLPDCPVDRIRDVRRIEMTFEAGQYTLTQVLHADDADVIFHVDVPDDLSDLDSIIHEQQNQEINESVRPAASERELRVTRDQEYSERVTRDRGHDAYTETVKELYGNQCAVCELKIEAPGGVVGENYALEAAHIQRASDDGPDNPPNRLSLCHRHHWMFDNGWIALTDDHTVLVKEAPEYAGYQDVKALHGDRIVLPDDPEAHPHPHFLKIHRKKHGFVDSDEKES